VSFGIGERVGFGIGDGEIVSERDWEGIGFIAEED
jgi:exopolysaccharide biosynthesis protein